jgi:hypothetical protein
VFPHYGVITQLAQRLHEVDSHAMAWTHYRTETEARLRGGGLPFGPAICAAIEALRDARTLNFLARRPAASVDELYRVALERL